MNNLLGMLALVFTASSSFAADLACKPAHAVRWSLENGPFGGEKGFSELELNKLSDVQLTIGNGLLVYIQEDYPTPPIMMPDFIQRDTSRNVEAISYVRRDRKWAGGFRMLFKDPYCVKHDRSKFSTLYLDVDAYINQLYECDCLSLVDHAEVFN